MEEVTQTAEQRLESGLAQQDLQDPREFFRERLRLLRQRDRALYQEALDYYNSVLLPNVSAPGFDTLFEWLEYGKRLAELSGPGRVVAIDAAGRAHPLPEQPPSGALILHIPDEDATPVLVLSAPRSMSAPQQASFDLLVDGRQSL